MEENHTLTEKTMDMLHNAGRLILFDPGKEFSDKISAEKTMEIAQNVKETLVGSDDGENKEEGATFDNVINEDGSLEFMQENILKENDEDVFARKEKETRDQFSDDELKRIAEYGIMGFTMTDDPNVQQTQKIPLSHEKQD